MASVALPQHWDRAPDTTDSIFVPSTTAASTEAASTASADPTGALHSNATAAASVSLHFSPPVTGHLLHPLPRYQAQSQSPTEDTHDEPANFLNFSDVASELSHLPFAAPASSSTTSTSSASSTTSTTTTSTAHPSPPSAPSTLISDAFNLASSRLAPRKHRQQNPPPSTPATAATPTTTVLRTSPGLAARLKALGFGASSSTAQPTAAPTEPNHIGRLNEEQLRELDEKHQLNSLESIIVRRGRPWKGTGPTTSPKQLPAQLDVDELGPQLPETIIPNDLVLDVMDTQKYRLPDHTNGNNTKADPDTLREHIARDSISLAEVVDNVTPPPPPPKDTPPASAVLNDDGPRLDSYFSPVHSRPMSIYTLSRVSFANQLSQLTSLQLPDAESLSSKVSAIPTAQAASTALINAAEQIRSWIQKASEVIEGLDSEDDVEWSAAGGREGLAEVENAILRFEELINVYVGAIEELQARPDIANVSTDDLNKAVCQMESIMTEWTKIRNTLQNVRGQVEIAMEWEELWNNVLGDIQGEMDELSRLVFEMEERRHKSIAAAAGGDGVDIGDLETIVEDNRPPVARLQAPNRVSFPSFPITPSSPETPALSQDDSSLLALFARMQPLRASLDFLPMRLSVFQARADYSFPTACDELEMRRTGLDASYKKLERDAESLRKELGEDRWVIVFRGVGRQAQKMHESVERSLTKLQESIDAGLHLSNPPAMVKKLESYEAKKTHYGPAIERVLSIIDKGVKDRLTVNGEIVRLRTDLESKWTNLKDQMVDMDATIDTLHVDRKGQHLRDSISSMVSNDRSTTAGSGHETPGSSPPSSIVMSSLGIEPYGSAKQRKARPANLQTRTPPSYRRQSSVPSSINSGRRLTPSRLPTTIGSSTTTPTHARGTPRSVSSLDHRPRWNTSTNASGIDTGHNFKPLTLTTPSPYSKRTPLSQRSVSSLTPGSAASKLPKLRTPLTRATSESPKVGDTHIRTGPSRLSFRERLASSTANAGQQPSPATTPATTTVPAIARPRPQGQSSLTASTEASMRRASFHPQRSVSVAGAHDQLNRPASSLASNGRRSSLMLQPKERRDSSTGRSTPSVSRLSIRKKQEPADNRPRWR
ncbi:unnamed protein product [Clonostachys chloroleuca]|uniref:Karyogamy protein KAR9 n=1 Tax=Clonostachys chloroleuca TaxID=1926264 RepID=A0AA35LSA3_9HYPO|nr:unnamed protein product [Clonostachys chloroleuca]